MVLLYKFHKHQKTPMFRVDYYTCRGEFETEHLFLCFHFCAFIYRYLELQHMHFLCILCALTQFHSISVDLAVEFEAEFCVPETF